MAAARTVDELDRRIVERLRIDGRETTRALADALGVSEATIAARLRRLEADQIVHVVALTDFERLGYEYLAFALLQVDERPTREVARDLAAVPQTLSVTIHTGRYDITCALLARDRAELSQIVGETIPSVDGVGSVRCESAADVVRFDSAWAILRGSPVGDLPQPPLPEGGIDMLDRRIIEALKRDARSSNRSIAVELGVSEGTVRGRLRRMERDHLLRIRAVSDTAAFDLRAGATIGIHVGRGHVDAVRSALEPIDEISGLMRTFGQFDFVVVALAESRAKLLDVVLERIQSIDAVRATETLEHVETVKHVYTWASLVTDREIAR